MRTIDVKYIDDQNEVISTIKGESTMLEGLKKAVEDLLSHAHTVQEAVTAAADAPNVERAIVDAVVAALEAQGFTVTAPAAPEAPAPEPVPEEAPPAA